MDLDDFFGPNAPVVDLHSKNRWDAIDELLDHLVANQKVNSDRRKAIEAAIKNRETAMSTGVGFGIALPHASTDLVSEVVGIIGRSREGIEFNALDRKPVRLVFLFLVPTLQFQKQVNTLANIAKLLHSQDFRDGLWGRFM